ncbi:MAG: hypothetical protein ACK5MD_04985 [Flavobacteriales bacterium]
MRFIYILILVLTYQLSNSQSCGSGKFIFEFYTKNHEKLKYKIKEVDIINKDLLFEDTYRGIILDSSKINGIKQFEFNKDKLPKLISQSLNCDDNINNNQLTFNTLELFNKFFLLKIWDKNNEIQILVNLFGGCNRKNIVVMSENPIIINAD